jgi:hypothetical protein
MIQKDHVLYEKHKISKTVIMLTALVFPEGQAGTAYELSEQKTEFFPVVNISPSFPSSSLDES